MALQTENISGVEVFSEGRHGGDFYSRADLQSMVDAFGALNFHPAIKADDAGAKRTFGAPALGYVSRLFLRGGKLLADFANVPRKVADVIRNQNFKRFSTEIYWQYRDESTGKVYPRALKALNIIGADLGPLDNLDAITSLFRQSSTAHAYDSQRLFKSYSYSETEGFKMNDTSLTSASREFAKVALEFAEQNEMDYPSAVKYLMRQQRERRYETQQSPSSPAADLAAIADRVQGLMKVDAVTAFLEVAKNYPAKTRQIADEWLLNKAAETARGRPGLSSANEAAALSEVIAEYPAVAAVRQAGKLTEEAARILFVQWFKG